MTIQGVMDVDEEVASDTWQRCDSLAFIVSTPPSRDVAKQREYYSLIGPQLLDLVSRSPKVSLEPVPVSLFFTLLPHS